MLKILKQNETAAGVCFHHPIDADPSLKELVDVPLGWYAKRAKPGEPWIRAEHASDEETKES